MQDANGVGVKKLKVDILELWEGFEPCNDDHITNLPPGNIHYYNSKNIYFEQKLIPTVFFPIDNNVLFSAITTTARFRKAKQNHNSRYWQFIYII
jgi:hypothetical protein